LGFLKTWKTDNLNLGSKRVLLAARVDFLDYLNSELAADFLECDFRERAANFGLSRAALASSRMIDRPLIVNIFWTRKTCQEDFGGLERDRRENLLKENAQMGLDGILNFGTLQQALLKQAEYDDKKNQVSQLAEGVFRKRTFDFQSYPLRLLDRRA